MINVCLLGDSIAKGIILDSDSGRYRNLSESFSALCASAINVSVENLSKFGSTVRNGMKSLEQYFKSGFNFSYILFEYGGNDCDFDWQAISDDPNALHTPKTDADEFIKLYKNMIHETRIHDCMPVLLSLPPIDSEKYFDTISRDRNATNILSWLKGDKGFISRWHETYNLAVFKLAQECAIPLFDITTCFYLRRNFTELLCADGIHPNAEGHRIIAERIIEYANYYNK